MNQEAIRDKLISQFGDEVVTGSKEFRGQICVSIDGTKVLDVMRFLRDDPDLAFDFLSFVAGTDRDPERPRFEIVYQLSSIKLNHRFRVAAPAQDTDDGGGLIDSVVEIWPTADWHERETTEMYGITFANHPDPRKLLLPEDWEVYPLRKDFPLEGTEEDTPDLLRKS